MKVPPGIAPEAPLEIHLWSTTDVFPTVSSEYLQNTLQKLFSDVIREFCQIFLAEVCKEFKRFFKKFSSLAQDYLVILFKSSSGNFFSKNFSISKLLRFFISAGLFTSADPLRILPEIFCEIHPKIPQRTPEKKNRLLEVFCSWDFPVYAKKFLESKNIFKKML